MSPISHGYYLVENKCLSDDVGIYGYKPADIFYGMNTTILSLAGIPWRRCFKPFRAVIKSSGLYIYTFRDRLF
jgi:hypothetical protein